MIDDMGRILMENGLISRSDLERAEQQAASSGRLLGTVLREDGLISDRDIAIAKAQALDINFIDLERTGVDRDIGRTIPEQLAFRYMVIPIMRNGNELLTAMAEPDNMPVVEYLGRQTGLTIKPAAAAVGEIEKSLQWAFYGG